jgi:hypothetical protein
VIHFGVRMFGRCYSLQRDVSRDGCGLGFLWSAQESSGARRWHCGSWALWVEDTQLPPIVVPGDDLAAAAAPQAADLGARFAMEWGQFALSF